MGDTIPKISYILFMSKSIIRLDVLALIHFSTRMDMISFCSFHFRCPGNCPRGKLTPVKVRVRVMVRVGWQFSSRAIVLEPCFTL